MKKNSSNRRRIAKLIAKEIKACQFYAIKGRQINASKVEIKFQRKYNTMGSVVFIDDASHKQTIIRWYDHRYFTLRYGAKEAKPLNMTLAKWETINND